MSPKLLALALILCAFAGLAHAQDHCTPIHFAPGTSSATIRGVATSMDEGAHSACYTLTTRRGQTAKLRMVHGPKDDVAFTIVGVVDDRDSYSFKTDAKTYTIGVFRTFAREPDEPFIMLVSVK